MFLAYNTTGNQFNNNITVNNTTGNGITFANNTGAAATLASGFTIQVGGTGFAAGELRLRNFTQLGPTAQNVTLTGTAIFRLGFNSTFNGTVDFRSPRVILDGATYNGTTYIEKTGVTNDDSNGNNVFNGPTTLANSGSGYLRSAVSTLDTFNGDLSLINTGSATIRMGDVVTGTVFNGNVQVTCTNGGGIWFGDNPPANATLAAGRTITVGAGGFTTGELRMNRFIQLGGTAQALTLTGDALLTLGPAASFGGNVTMVAPRLRLDGATYAGTGYFEKTGAVNDAGTGNNTFGGATQLVNTGSGYLMSASGGPDVFNGDLTVTNSSSSLIYLAHSVAGTQFNGNIALNTTSGNGIYISDNAAGSATLAAGRTIAIGGVGWNSGDLHIRRFTQTGGTPQTVIIPPRRRHQFSLSDPVQRSMGT
ncbi:MAG: hypothetical protein HC859_11675 [Bacteroidia bacterium]|nr:hypothetical protein [Bacteroidia bacterium]